MTDFQQFEADALLMMTQCSEANFTSWASPSGMEVEVSRIMYRSPRTEADGRIGGIFHCGDRFFLQCLEGPCEALRFYFERTREDERHRNVEVTLLTPLDRRRFRRGTMSYAGLRQPLLDLQRRNGQGDFNPYRFDQAMIEEFIGLYLEHRRQRRRA
ncbi:MAG: BLUF domain-containing protein [Wenzhouxiangellaceae bacterium]